MSIVASSLGSSQGEKMVAFLWGFVVFGGNKSSMDQIHPI